MSKKAPTLEIDPCVLTPSKASKKIQSMVNKKYEDNIEMFRKIIARNNKQYIEEQYKVANLVIKSVSSSSIDNSVSDFFTLVSKNICDNTEIEVLKTIIRASMYKMPKDSIYAQTVYLREIEKARSIKLYNISLNLHKIWSLILESYSFNSNATKTIAISYFLSVIKVISIIRDVLTIKITDAEAITLITIYSFDGNPSKEQIEKRVSESDLTDNYNIDEILKHLVDIGTIELYDGKYRIVEEIII